MINSDYTPAVDKKILSAMKKKGTSRKTALEKIAKSTNIKYITILARGYALAAKKNKKAVVKDHSGSMKSATATTKQVRVKFKTVNVDFESNELVFTI